MIMTAEIRTLIITLVVIAMSILNHQLIYDLILELGEEIVYLVNEFRDYLQKQRNDGVK